MQARNEQLQNAIWDSSYLKRFVVWNNWYRHGPVATLHGNNLMLDQCGLDSQELLRRAGWDSIDVADRVKGVRRVKKKFQRTVKKALFSKDRPDPVARVRHKLARWNLAGLPRVTASRCAKLLKDLKRLVPACVRCGLENYVERLDYRSTVPGAWECLFALLRGSIWRGQC